MITNLKLRQTDLLNELEITAFFGLVRSPYPVLSACPLLQIIGLVFDRLNVEMIVYVGDVSDDEWLSQSKRIGCRT